MYLSEHDPVESLAVWYFSACNRAEWEQHFAHLRDLAQWSARTGKRAAVILIPAGFEVPDTDMRIKLTELTQAPGYDPQIAFVAPNKAAQAVLTMFSWFQRQPRYETKYVSNVDDGITWLEGRRGAPLPKLAEMAERVLERANAIRTEARP